ncbi:MAG: RecQ family ATP-dependent DNA helicase [Bacteroidales bacterium]|nr:RecQ family ATP-dependent DNA helicase [Bacteroidales bacterium]
MDIKNILIKYWGYSEFRPMQEDIINSVLEGKDTLALLPTGGGKSVCFQVPAMAKEGLCLVVTPLIALMKDQVENLRKNGIKAVAIHSGMHKGEIDLAMDNCFYGNVKFLYVSPERLSSPDFRAAIQNMNINLLAVDEAHCISQWGYDFRPPYLKIAEVKTLIPDIPILALTATAVPEVVKDIQKKLEFKKENLFQKSFARENLTYVVFQEDDKLGRLLRIVNKINGTGIIYVRNRRKTREISEFLKNNKISSEYYHAGLDASTRTKRQNDWMKGKIRVIVSTNAFGMGIDKSNVRLVIHMDIPDSLEAYFQEAGRAGRDGKQSYAVLLFENADIINSKQNLKTSFPERDVIKAVYQGLGNYFQLAVGSGKDVAFDFDLNDFCKNYNFSPLIAYNSLKFLEKEAYILMNEFVDVSSKIHFLLNKEDLYRFQIENKFYDGFIKLILRSYSGVFNDFININENEIANRSDINSTSVIKYLQQLNKLDVLTYIPRKNKPQILFSRQRFDRKDLLISKENYKDRKSSASKRVQSVIDYATSKNKCRSQYLLSYFGENDSTRCGKCDVCVERNKININEIEFDNVVKQIKPFLKKNPHTLDEIVKHVEGANEDKIINIIQWLKDNDKIYTLDDNRMAWKQQFTLNLK